MVITDQDGSYLVCLAIQLHLMGLHDLLDGLPNVTQPHIDAGCLETRVGRLPDSLQERIVAWVERNCER